MSKKRFLIKATTYNKKGRVISIGFNNYLRTHPIQAHYAACAGLGEKQMLHAEILSIIRARGTKIHKIKIERYDNDGNPKLAKPCPVCELAIKEAKIKFVEYTVG